MKVKAIHTFLNGLILMKLVVFVLTASMCLRNLTFTLPLNPPEIIDVHGEFHRISDSTTGRYSWINNRNNNLKWHYKSSNQHWIYKDMISGHELIACSPGYVDMPIYCTNYGIWAENGTNIQTNKIATSPTDGGITIWKLGPCYTSSPTIQTTPPTLIPTTDPTLKPTTSPTKASNDKGNIIMLIIIVIAAVVAILCVIIVWDKIASDRKKLKAKHRKSQFIVVGA